MPSGSFLLHEAMKLSACIYDGAGERVQIYIDCPSCDDDGYGTVLRAKNRREETAAAGGASVIAGIGAISSAATMVGHARLKASASAAATAAELLPLSEGGVKLASAIGTGTFPECSGCGGGGAKGMMRIGRPAASLVAAQVSLLILLLADLLFPSEEIVPQGGLAGTNRQ